MSLPITANNDGKVHTGGRSRPRITWLFTGPLIGGILTHCYDVVIMNRYTVGSYSEEIIYAAEVAPHLEVRERRQKRRNSRSAHLEDFYSRDETEDLGRTSRSRNSHYGRDAMKDRPDYYDNSDLPQLPQRRSVADYNSYIDDDEYADGDEDECVPMHSWQTSHHPMCNMLHEMDFHSNFRSGDLEYIDSGG